MVPWLPFETERLLLREFQGGDETEIQESAGDAEVAKFMDWGPGDIARTRAILARRLNEQRVWPRDTMEIAVQLKLPPRLIGSMRLSVLDWSNRSADFGYTFNRNYWGNGYATEGARALLHLGFVNLRLHRLWATCDTRNHASYRVMEKLGMRREGIFRKDILQKGEWRDSYLYAILAQEWLPDTTSDGAKQ